MTARECPNVVVVERVSALGGVDLVHAHFRGKATPPHSHPEAEIGVVLSGQRLVRCRGRTYQAPAGSVVIFRPGEIHAGAKADGDGSTYRAFLIPSATLKLSSAWQPDSDRDALPWFEAPVVADAALARALGESHAALEAGGGGPELDTRLRGLLDTLARRHHRRQPSWAARPQEHVAVARVRAHLEGNYLSKVRSGELSEIGGLSAYHLIRIFRMATGVPPSAYLAQVRVNRAAVLLRDGYSVSRVAILTGFADQSHLTRFFTRLVGVPPGRYQRGALLARAPHTRHRPPRRPGV